jgi:hypothetical protein
MLKGRDDAVNLELSVDICVLLLLHNGAVDVGGHDV